MSAPQFTPGPWGVWSDLDVVSLPSGDTLATVYGSPFDRDDAKNAANRKANARLIAAAPELYEALAKIADENSSFVVGPTARAFARTILAKARGERDEDAELLLDAESHYSETQLEEIALAKARGAQ
jgi:hypothetical protein